MNRIAAQFETRKRRTLMVVAALAALTIAIGCSKSPAPQASASQPIGASVHPFAYKTVEPAIEKSVQAVGMKERSAEKPHAEFVNYRSRDYGLSFEYPWQYAYFGARAVLKNDSLQPKSDGYDGQFTLARIDIPKGFYADTNFESGYFTAGLNQEISEEECNSMLAGPKDAKAQTDTINGVDFLWMETSTGGHGSAEQVRDYVGFVNGSCYEFEMGVTTRNERGLAREVDPSQVFHRLDAILRTVKIEVSDDSKATKVASSTETPAPAPEN